MDYALPVWPAKAGIEFPAKSGIRLFYPTTQSYLPADIKEGILLEVGFDDITPNTPRTMSSWIYDFAQNKVDSIDNRAISIPCYDPGYTLVEKLQAISTKFRKEQENQFFSENFMRHYYDVYCLLKNPEVQTFISSIDYQKHKQKRFRAQDNLDIQSNDAFILSDNDTRKKYEEQYNQSISLYYTTKPSFTEILAVLKENMCKL